MTEVRPVWVRRMLYGVPRRARVVWPADRSIALVLHHGRIVVLTEVGELDVPDERQAELREQYFPEEHARIRAATG